MTKPIVTADRLRELFDYSPETGVFTKLVRTRYRDNIGDVCGWLTPKGYVQMCVDKRHYMAHRLAFLYVHGRFPDDQIDHINGQKADNRILNLRESTPSENQQNKRKARVDNNTSGLLGSSWHAQCNKWVAYISLNGKRRHLGVFDTAELAHLEYLRAKSVLHPFSTL